MLFFYLRHDRAGGVTGVSFLGKGTPLSGPQMRSMLGAQNDEMHEEDDRTVKSCAAALWRLAKDTLVLSKSSESHVAGLLSEMVRTSM